MGKYFRLVDINDASQKEKVFLMSNDINSQRKYSVSNEVFYSLPGLTISYWLSDKFINIFNNSNYMSNYASCCTGMQTGNNGKYICLWFEVSYLNTQLCSSNGAWYRYNCGGEPRKWYGNHFNLVYWADNGYDIKHEKSSVIRNERFFFNEGITWKRITGSSFNLRYLPKGFIFDQAGDSMFPKNSSELFYLLAYVNSVVAFKISECISPTLNLTAGNMEKIPVILNEYRKEEVDSMSRKNINLCKEDWDSYETSWDFRRHPLI